MIKRLISFLLTLVFLVAIPLEAKYRYNPYTRKLDYYEPASDVDLGDIGDITLTGLATGDILYYSGAAWVNLGVGANGEILTLAGGIPSWAAGGAPAAHAASHEVGGADLIDHDAVTGLGDDDHTQYGERTQAESVTGLWNFIASGVGGLNDYDLTVGDVATPDYGLICFGDSVIGRTSHNAAALDLDGAVIFRNVGGPVSGEIEFVWTESAGASVIRFALPKSGAGNATYNPRSMLIAGPAVNNDDVVTVGYWQTTNSIFDNLACDTAGDGADLGVQNDLEVEGDMFVDSIKESTTGAGVLFTAAYKHVVVPAGQFTKIGGGSPPDIGNQGTFATALYDKTTTQEAFYNFHIPEDWKTGTDITLKVYWAPTTNDVGKHVQWEADWEAVKTAAAAAGEILAAGSTNIELHDDTYAGAWNLQETAEGIIAGASLEEDDVIGIKISRLIEAADNYEDDAALIHLEIEYQADKLGEAT